MLPGKLTVSAVDFILTDNVITAILGCILQSHHIMYLIVNQRSCTAEYVCGTSKQNKKLVDCIKGINIYNQSQLKTKSTWVKHARTHARTHIRTLAHAHAHAHAHARAHAHTSICQYSDNR